MGQFNISTCSEDYKISELFTMEQNAFDNSLVYINTDGVILWSNKFATKEFNQKLIGKRACDVFSVESAKQCNEDNLEIIKHKSNAYINQNLTLITGETKNLFTIKSPWVIDQKQVAGIFISHFCVDKFFEDDLTKSNYEDKAVKNSFFNRLRSLCFDVKPLLKEILINVNANDEHFLLQNFTKKLLSSCDLVLKRQGFITSNQIPVASQPINLRNLIQETIARKTETIKRTNFRFIFTANNRVPEIVVGDFIRIQKIIRVIIENLLKFAPEIGNKEIICHIELMYSQPGNVSIMFEAESFLFEEWATKEKSLQYKFSLISELSNNNNYQLGLSLVKDLIEELNGNIDLIEFNKTTKMIIEIPDTLNHL